MEFTPTDIADVRRAIWIPPGFAHGFFVQSELAEIEYHRTDFCAPRHEWTICRHDPEIAIAWPLRDGEESVLDEKDATGERLKDAEVYA